MGDGCSFFSRPYEKIHARLTNPNGTFHQKASHARRGIFIGGRPKPLAKREREVLAQCAS
jgi:hypothetical protein